MSCRLGRICTGCMYMYDCVISIHKSKTYSKTHNLTGTIIHVLFIVSLWLLIPVVIGDKRSQGQPMKCKPSALVLKRCCACAKAYALTNVIV